MTRNKKFILRFLYYGKTYQNNNLSIIIYGSTVTKEYDIIGKR